MLLSTISVLRLIVHIIARCSSLTIILLYNYNRRVNCCIAYKDTCERFLILPASRIINREPVSYICHFSVSQLTFWATLVFSPSFYKLLRDIFTKESIHVVLLFRFTYICNQVTAHDWSFIFFSRIYFHCLHRFTKTTHVFVTTIRITII